MVQLYFSLPILLFSIVCRAQDALFDRRSLFLSEHGLFDFGDGGQSDEGDEFTRLQFVDEMVYGPFEGRSGEVLAFVTSYDLQPGETYVTVEVENVINTTIALEARLGNSTKPNLEGLSTDPLVCRDPEQPAGCLFENLDGTEGDLYFWVELESAGSMMFYLSAFSHSTKLTYRWSG